MPQFAIVGPGSIFDLGNQSRLNEDDPLLVDRNRSTPGLQRVQHPAQFDSIFLFEASPDGTDIDERVALIGREQQTADPAACCRGWLVSDNHKAFTLDAFDLQPVAEPARSINAVAVLGDDAFQAVLARGRKKCRAIRFDLL